jgi:hypothetical protein
LGRRGTPASSMEHTVLIVAPDSRQSRNVASDLRGAGYNVILVPDVDEGLRRLNGTQSRRPIINDRLSADGLARFNERVSLEI